MGHTMAPLSVLAVVLFASSCAQAASAPTFAQWANQARFGGFGTEDAAGPGEKVSTAAVGSKASAAASGSNPAASSDAKVEAASGYYAESKHVCLQEVRHKDCRWFGCPAATAGTGCQTGSFMTSEFSCCNHNDDHNYGYGATHNMFMPKNSIGSCDWSIQWFQYNVNDMCPWVSVIDGITYKVGTATGTCYFGSGCELCGEPLCSQMVISVQGDVFRTAAYSHELPQVNEDQSCTDNMAWINLPPNSGTGTGEPCENVMTARTVGARAPATENQAAASNSTRRGRNLLAGQQYGYGYGEYGYHAGTTQTIYKGTAFIISGTIDSVSAPHSHEGGGDDTHGCNKGLFEWVPFFSGDAVPTGDPINSAIPWIHPNDYKLEFSCASDKGYERYAESYDGYRRKR